MYLCRDSASPDLYRRCGEDRLTVNAEQALAEVAGKKQAAPPYRVLVVGAEPSPAHGGHPSRTHRLKERAHGPRVT